MTTATIGAAQARAGRFYVWLASVFILVAFGGFAATYWLRWPVGTFPGHPILHVHATLFSSWVLFFWWQTWQAANGRIAQHRAWGVAGVSLATGMLFVGLAAAVQSIREGIAGGYGDQSRSFSIVAVSSLVLFEALVAAAILNVRRPEWHKRLLVVATASILQAAVARLVLVFVLHQMPGPGQPPPPVQVTLGPAIAVDLLIIAGMVHDWRTRGRPHPAYLWAGALLLVVQVARVPLSTTPAWLAVADFLTLFAG
jgi:hypothetical protein